MTAVPILSGMGTTPGADFEQSYPVNLEPVPLKTGISDGYLRSAPGASQFAIGPGTDRGAIAWNGLLYRVMGTKLIAISQDGAVTVIGDVGGARPVAIDYGFDRLAVASDGSLWYYNQTALTKVTDTDLGNVVDMLWMSGYYVCTDGTSLIVTQLSDPTSIDPIKYGSAEEDPDAITGLFKLRGELYALGANTIQVFSNTGGSGFPFTANTAGTVPVGCVGPRAKCAFLQTMAFVGNGRDEAPAVYLLDGGSATKISTRTIDDELALVSDPTTIILEGRMSRDERRLLVHLPTKTLCYYANASRLSQERVWSVLASGSGGDEPYRLRNAVDCYGKTFVGDATGDAIGALEDDVSTHFGAVTGWQFQTDLIYNAAKGAILHTAELIGLPGRASSGDDPVAFMSTSKDGLTWSPDRPTRIGARGERGRRCSWRPHMRFRRHLTMRFRGAAAGLVGWAACEAEIEGLSA